MISIRKYLDRRVVVDRGQHIRPAPVSNDSSPADAWARAYGSALEAFVQAASEACPAVTPQLSAELADLFEQLGPDTLHPANVDERVHRGLHAWGRRAAVHGAQQARELRQMLLAMAHTAQSVGDRDNRCAVEMEMLTSSLRSAATLDDLTQIRHSIEQSAREIKACVERFAAEGKAELQGMQKKIAEFQERVEEAEQAASVDRLTHLRTRLWTESQIQQRVAQGSTFCVALIDLDGFKFVNDRHGHLAGDELLRQFATELRSACRSSDLVGRWGGDEFLIIMDCGLSDAQAQMRRIRQWVCGTYQLPRHGLKLRVEASMGLAVFTPPETLEHLLERADRSMYADKSSRR